MFRRVPLSIIRSFSLYTQKWYMSHRFADSLRANQLDALTFKFIFGIKLYMFQTVPLCIIRSFSLYTQQWYIPLASSQHNLYDIYLSLCGQC